MGWSLSPLALCPMQVTQGAELQERAREVEVRKLGHACCVCSSMMMSV